MKIRIVLFLILLITSNFKSHGQYSIGLLEEKFTDGCVIEFKSLLKQFDNHVVKKTNISNLELAYTSFMNKLKDAENAEEYLSILSLNDMNLDSIVKSLIISRCFSEIWVFEYGIDYKTKDTLSAMININTNSNYFSLLRSMSESDKKMEEYFRCFQESGGISPGMIANYTNLASSFNFGKVEYRLVFAIHLLTIGYRIEYQN
jgi:hypothetical protein